jgi:cell division protein FtsL
MAQAILDRLTFDGQIAFLLAAVILTAIALVLMLWRPRHVTYRAHDCRSMGCEWLEDSPRVH